MDNYTVYRHTAPNGKMYVGITKHNVKRRWDCGRGYRKQPLFFNAINKYGWENFKHEILLEGLTKEQACLAEQIFIFYWGLNNRDNGYNLESGGIKNTKLSEETKREISKKQVGRKASEETKKRMSQAQKEVWANEEYKKFMSSIRQGRKFSEEHKRNLSEAHNKYKKPVFQIDQETGNVIAYFDSIVSAGKALGINNPRKSKIGDCCKNKRKTAHGFKWAYADRGDVE